MIVHNVKGWITRDHPDMFTFDKNVTGSGWGVAGAFVGASIKENLRQRGYLFPIKVFASIEFPEYAGKRAVVVEIYFSKKR